MCKWLGLWGVGMSGSVVVGFLVGLGPVTLGFEGLAVAL